MPIISLKWSWLPQKFEPAGIQSEEYEKEHGKGPERRSSVTKKWQRNSNDWQQANGHSDINNEMYQYNGDQPVTKYPAKGGSLSFCQENHP